MNGFKANQGSEMTVTDGETKMEVNLLPSGKRVDPGPLTLPMPAAVSDKPQILNLEALIGAELSTYMGRVIDRNRDYADVGKLVHAKHLARECGVGAKVQAEHLSIWDACHPPNQA